MEFHSDSDSNSESDYDSDQESATRSDEEDVNELDSLEPEPSVHSHDEYECHWTPEDQMKAQINATLLRQLQANIQAQAQVPTNPTYQRLPRAWPPRPFDVRILPDSVQEPIHYFELFWTSDIWNILVQNTNAYAIYQEACSKGNKNTKQKSQ